MKKTILLFLATLLSAVNFAQTVTTYTDGTPDDAIAIDENGAIYASNFTGDTVFKFDSNGNASTFVSGLDTPNGIAFNSNGDFYVCDFNANMLFRYDSNGVFDNSIEIPGRPSGIIKAFDNDDMIYTRFALNRINRVTPSGVSTEISADPALNGPVGLAYDEAGNLFVGNFISREIFKVEANGDLTYIATVGNSSNLGFIAYGQGMLWGTVLGEHKIYAINPNEIDDVTLFAGSTAGSQDGDISVATFNLPDGILFSEDEETMYITDFGTKNLRIISDVVLSNPDVGAPKIEVVLYPNPVIDKLTIEARLLSASGLTIKVVDISGSVIFEKEIASREDQILETIDTNEWSSGLYFVHIKSEELTVVRKFTK